MSRQVQSWNSSRCSCGLLWAASNSARLSCSGRGAVLRQRLRWESVCSSSTSPVSRQQLSAAQCVCVCVLYTPSQARRLYLTHEIKSLSVSPPARPFYTHRLRINHRKTAGLTLTTSCSLRDAIHTPTPSLTLYSADHKLAAWVQQLSTIADPICQTDSESE